jgi:hypothetical protein
MNIYERLALALVVTPVAVTLAVVLFIVASDAIKKRDFRLLIKIYILIVLSLFFIGRANASNSQAYLHIQGVVRPVVTFTVTKESSKVYNISVLSNNPNGFTAIVTTDTEQRVLAVASQTETKTYNYTLSFTNAPAYVNVSVQGD